MGLSTQAQPQISTQVAAITLLKKSQHLGIRYEPAVARNGGAPEGKAGERAGSARSDQADLLDLSISSK